MDEQKQPVCKTCGGSGEIENPVNAGEGNKWDCPACQQPPIETIKSAAVRNAAGKIFGGFDHAKCIKLALAENKEHINFDQQGFVTNTGWFVSRAEAAKIAYNARQVQVITDELFSEDLNYPFLVCPKCKEKYPCPKCGTPFSTSIQQPQAGEFTKNLRHIYKAFVKAVPVWMNTSCPAPIRTVLDKIPEACDLLDRQQSENILIKAEAEAAGSLLLDVQQDCIKLRKKLESYRIQYKAAMRATSLGLCKKAIKHAMEDEQSQK